MSEPAGVAESGRVGFALLESNGLAVQPWNDVAGGTVQ